MADGRVCRVTMPKWGLSMETGKIVEWFVSVGDEVHPGDDLVDIDTEKIAGALESTAGGVLRAVVAQEGSAAPVGATIAVVAPADVPEDDIDAVVAEAREEIASGVAVQPEGGPEAGSVEVSGRQLSHVTMGSGEDAVVLVHGYGGDKNSWLFVQEPLSAGHTVHALDLPGHGESSKDVGDGTVDTLAAAVLGFLDAKGITAAHLVGHSLGAAVVTAAAAAAPDRVRSLALIGPAGCGDRIDAAYLRGFAAAGTRRELKPLLGRLFADPGQVNRQLVDDLLRYKRLDGVAAALATLVNTLLDGDAQAIDIRPALAAVQVPVAVVWGAADRIIPPEHQVGGHTVQLVDGAGHMVHMEAPSAVRAAVSAVLAST